MAFTFAAFCYMLSLVLCAALIFFAIWHVSNLLPASNSFAPKTPLNPTLAHFGFLFHLPSTHRRHGRTVRPDRSIC